jgi:propane monooxygenase small subunit
MQLAALHGDYTTPSVVGAGESDFFRDLRYTKDMYGLLVNDETYGQENRSTLQSLLSEWVPLSVRAARNLQPLWSQPGQRVIRFEDAFDAVKERFTRLVREFGLSSEKELEG